MIIRNQAISFQKLDENTAPPYDLLLLADPSKHLIDEYLKKAEVFVAKQNKEVVGVAVLISLTTETVEIKNIAVKPSFQNQGTGSYLLKNIIEVAINNKQKNICICTANSSIGQLYLYQKLGFEISEIKVNFFVDNYSEPIYENNIQAKHLLVLTKSLG